MIKPFFCPDCEKTLDLTYVPNRKRCPDCAHAHAKVHDEETRKKNREQYREKKQAKREQEAKKKAKEMTPQQKLDAEQNAKAALQMKQCRNCEYHRKEFGLEYCDYISWTGHRCDKGNGPGDCRSFLKRGTKGRAERMARRRIALAQSDIDHAYT